MASSPADLPIHRFPGAGGLAMAYRETGEGRPLVLIHGLFSNGWTNWVRYGHAARLAEAGFRVIMPDLRGHGESAAPHDLAAYPPDVLAADGEALVAHLGLTNYDLGGYSLGGRTTLRMLVRGARPRRAVLAGMGLGGILDTTARGDFYRQVLTRRGQHPRGTGEWMAEAFLKTTGGDPEALIHVLDTFVDTDRAQLADIAVETCVICGSEDHDNGSGAALAEALGNGQFAEIPGNHMSAVLKPPLAEEMVRFLRQ